MAYTEGTVKHYFGGGSVWHILRQHSNIFFLGGRGYGILREAKTFFLGGGGMAYTEGTVKHYLGVGGMAYAEGAVKHYLGGWLWHILLLF